MLKAPQKAYRIYEPSHIGWRGRTLLKSDELAVGGGDGTGMLGPIKKTAGRGRPRSDPSFCENSSGQDHLPIEAVRPGCHRRRTNSEVTG
jgi:hypothetical protein